jgi:hypothetical protein
MKKIIADTFTPLYDAIEDRIRLVINYQNIDSRVDLMITRSFILEFLPTMDEFVLNHYGLENITIETKNKDPEVSPSSTTTDNIDLELYKKQDELLTKVDFAFYQQTQQTQLKLYTTDTQIEAPLDKELLKNLLRVIKASVPYINWGISPDF